MENVVSFLAEHRCGPGGPVCAYGVEVEAVGVGSNQIGWFFGENRVSTISFCPLCGARLPRRLDIQFGDSP